MVTRVPFQALRLFRTQNIAGPIPVNGNPIAGLRILREALIINLTQRPPRGGKAQRELPVF